MLNYGADVQKAFDYNDENLPNADLGAYADFGTAETPELNATSSITGTGTVDVAQVAFSMQSRVEMQLLFLDDISAYTVKATVNGEGAKVIIGTDTFASNGWTVVKVLIATYNMREDYTIALYDADGNAVTQVYQISAEACAKLHLGGTYNDLTIAMMKYGDSLAALAEMLGL